MSSGDEKMEICGRMNSTTRKKGGSADVDLVNNDPQHHESGQNESRQHDLEDDDEGKGGDEKSLSSLKSDSKECNSKDSKKDSKSKKGSPNGPGRGWPKGKKRYPKSPGAPKCSLSAYVHFLNDRRESFRKENPELSFAEVSKKLALEWSSLTEDDKVKYNKMAVIDRERYNREFEAYTQTEQYQEYVQLMEKKKAQKKQEKLELKAAKKAKKKSDAAAAAAAAASGENPSSSIDGSSQPSGNGSSNIHPIKGGFDIPIFTDEFLEHNKAKETELRQLKRQTNEYEEQNAVLQKHLDNMGTAITKLERENTATAENNAALEAHLNKLRQMVISNFSSIALKKHNGRLNIDNVDEYMVELNSFAFQEKPEDKTMMKLKNAAMKIDLSVGANND